MAFTLLLAAGIVASVATHPVRAPALGQPMRFDADSIGEPMSSAPVELWRPPGVGPFPVVVLLAGCGGVGDSERHWAARLTGWGYAAAILDSLRPRHIKARCGRSGVSTDLRAQDLANLVKFLRTAPGIAADRIGVIGFSQGSGAALFTALEGVSIAPPFQALVAYYPGCRLPPRSHLSVDTLILFGADDNPASIERCKALALALRDTRHPAALIIYPHATHNFDDTNSEAATQSFAAAEAFLAEHLKAR